MKNFTQLFSLTILVLSFSLSAREQVYSQQIENQQTRNFHKLTGIQVQKAGTVNLSQPTEIWAPFMQNTGVIPAPAIDREKELYKALKAEANRIARENAQNAPLQPAARKTATATSPTLGVTFQGNYFSGIPNDNDVAVGRNNKIVSVTNSLLFTYNSTGAVQGAAQPFSTFYNTNDLQFDPKIIYDPTEDKWIFVWLNGDRASNSKVVVCFSQTDDPTGNWNVYPFPGNPDPGTFGPGGSDYPQIGLSMDELFVTGNMFTDSGSYINGYIFQIDKSQGFSGAPSLNNIGWGGNPGAQNIRYMAMQPASEAPTLSSPNMYFVSSRNVGSTNSIWLHEITNTIASGSAQFNTYSLTGSIPYLLSPDGNQLGTNLPLDTKDCRIRSAYMANDKIQFALNAFVNNRPGVYYGTVSNLAIPAFASCTMQMVGIDSFDIAYPSVRYGGCADGQNLNNSLLFFDFASSSHYPGNAVLTIDGAGTQSPPIVCKWGENFIDGYPGSPNDPNPMRWGDYTGMANHPDNPFECWAAGYRGYSPSGHFHGTWISQIFAPSCLPNALGPVEKEDSPKVQVYPVPTMENVHFKFQVPENGSYAATVYSLEGKLVRNLLNKRMQKGEGVLSFNTEYLVNGHYFLILSHEGEEIFKERFLVNH